MMSAIGVYFLVSGLDRVCHYFSDPWDYFLNHVQLHFWMVVIHVSLEVIVRELQLANLTLFPLSNFP